MMSKRYHITYIFKVSKIDDSGKISKRYLVDIRKITEKSILAKTSSRHLLDIFKDIYWLVTIRYKYNRYLGDIQKKIWNRYFAKISNRYIKSMPNRYQIDIFAKSSCGHLRDIRKI